ncbi:hypothetical protein GCM10025787_26960 [Saccharopolyspora rosea]
MNATALDRVTGQRPGPAAPAGSAGLFPAEPRGETGGTRVPRSATLPGMAPFDPSAECTQQLDFQLVRNGFVTLFRSRSALGGTTSWLTERGYRVVTVDASGWTADADLHRDLAAALDFPDYYGANLDALNDCLSDVAWCEYGASRESTGFVLVLDGYDAFARHRPRSAHAVLDMFADQARAAALIGHRMMCLVRSDDPRLSFDVVGATPVLWNPRESR